MNFKEALIAHLQGNNVQKRTEWKPEWVPLTENAEHATLAQILDPRFASNCEFRLAPRTIIVNGVDIPMGEKEAPKDGATYYIPDFGERLWYYELEWGGDKLDLLYLERGVVYLNKEDAIARAKAMLIVQEV